MARIRQGMWGLKEVVSQWVWSKKGFPVRGMGGV